MKRLAIFSLTCLSFCTVALAKPSLPVVLDCVKNSATSATVSVETTRLAGDLTVTIAETGSVRTEKLVKHFTSVSKGKRLTFPVAYTAGTTPGGVVVQVTGDFGGGDVSEIRTFDLVDTASQSSANDVRARAEGGDKKPGEPIIVPSRTTTKQR